MAGFGVWGLGFWVLGLGFRVSGLGFTVVGPQPQPLNAASVPPAKGEAFSPSLSLPLSFFLSLAGDQGFVVEGKQFRREEHLNVP